MSVTTAIFDFGNVLVRWDPPAALEELYPGRGEAEQALAAAGFAQWNAEVLDAGGDIEDSLAAIRLREPDRYPVLNAYLANIDKAHRDLVDGTSDIVEELSAGGTRLLGMTNAGFPGYDAMRRRAPVTGLMDDIFVSARERLLKPERQAFLRLLERNGLAPAACVFIDDTEANVAGARAAGLHAIRFIDAGQLRDDLAGLGLLASRAAQ